MFVRSFSSPIQIGLIVCILLKVAQTAEALAFPEKSIDQKSTDEKPAVEQVELRNNFPYQSGPYGDYGSQYPFQSPYQGGYGNGFPGFGPNYNNPYYQNPSYNNYNPSAPNQGHVNSHQPQQQYPSGPGNNVKGNRGPPSPYENQYGHNQYPYYNQGGYPPQFPSGPGQGYNNGYGAPSHYKPERPHESSYNNEQRPVGHHKGKDSSPNGNQHNYQQQQQPGLGQDSQNSYTSQIPSPNQNKNPAQASHANPQENYHSYREVQPNLNDNQKNPGHHQPDKHNVGHLNYNQASKPSPLLDVRNQNEPTSSPNTANENTIPNPNESLGFENRNTAPSNANNGLKKQETPAWSFFEPESDV